MDQAPVEKHTTLQSVIYHLLPGILIGCFYYSTRAPLEKLGYPGTLALILGIVFVLIPVELGILLIEGKKATGRFTLKGVIGYRNPLLWWQTLLWVVVVLVAVGALFTVLKPVDAALKDGLFFWLPGLNAGLDGEYSKSALVLTYALFFVFGTVLGPLVEEWYFRGFLLPRMNGKFAPVLHSVLFAVYHFWTPWMIVARAVGMLPLIYIVRKKNITIGIIAHIGMNFLDVLAGLAFIASMT